MSPCNGDDGHLPARKFRAERRTNEPPGISANLFKKLYLEDGRAISYSLCLLVYFFSIERNGQVIVRDSSTREYLSIVGSVNPLFQASFDEWILEETARNK